MERTTEFYGLLKLFGAIDLPTEGGSIYESATPERPEEEYFPIPSSDFAVATLKVAKGFSGTLRLVQRLQKLVTRKGLHNDPTAEIEDVTAVFKKDLGQLQRDIEALLRYAEGSSLQQGGDQRRRHCTCVVDGLKARAGEHTKLFQEALSIRQHVLKEQADRRRLFTHSAKKASIAYDSPLFQPPPPPLPTVENGRRSLPPQQPPPQSLLTSPSPLPPRPTPAPPTTTTANNNPYRMQLPQATQAPQDTTLRRRYAPPSSSAAQQSMRVTAPGPAGYMMQQQQQRGGDTATRLQDARAIEKTITELGQTFSKMAGLVAAQAEIAVRIDDDMEMALEDVKKGHSEMENFLRIVRGNRAVIVKVFLILIAFIILFVRYF